ncbi:two-component sensor histidine kinase [Agromyces sp. CFH 90414]|uniref:histidine kinase n=2 Tax=Agromyces agglutinans TaxID=2662258 RepID=A0A6I2F9D6_9MICO|nr:two-component sensor histidine kinase [Agromyces agglutinans]
MIVSATVTDRLPPAVAVAQLGAVVVAGAAILLFRRRRPWLLLIVAASVCLLVYPFGTTDVLPLLLALYALAVYRSTRSAWIGFGISVAVATLSSYLAVWVGGDDTVVPFGAPALASASQFTVFLLIATLIGVTVGNRRRYLNALIARAHDLARERDQQAQLATALERSRIAREMHDIVSHSLTVMVTLADGSAATADRDPGRAAEAMRQVAETGRAALADMRRMLGVLARPEAPTPEVAGAPAGPDGPDAPVASQEPGDLAPQPGTADLPDLVERYRAAGLPVRLETAGAPITDANLQLTVYRIVQEGLTNALRYAPSAHLVEVAVEHAAGMVRVDVVDDGTTAASTGAATGSATRSASGFIGGGNGLVGMRERVALYGGTVEAGPRAAGGWRVHAELRAEEDRA